jgi:hypothetical protein
MAASRIKTKRTGTGWLMLFALPFAAVGVGASLWTGWTLLEWRKTSAWVPVTAEVTSVELEEHADDDGTTYETKASYDYSYAGQRFSGTRVAIDSGADNIGDFQQRLYRQLRAAHESRTAVTAYVDPTAPENAVLNRELRAGLLALKGVFAIVFGAVGFGLLIGARASGQKLAAEQSLRERYPGEPWRWRPEWSSARISSSARGAALVAIGFAVLWNLVSLPILLFVPDEVMSGNRVAAVGFLFPLIGVGLAAWATRAWLQFRRFKVAHLELDRHPVAVGGRIKGTIRVDAEVPVTSDFRLELACSEERTTGSGKNRRRSERLVWQKQWRVPRHQCQIASMATTIPVDAPVPADQPPTSLDEDGDSSKISWRLDVTGECAGPDFWSRFELPVFAVAAHEAARELLPAAPAPSAERPSAATFDALGIDYERLAQGGEAWTFRRGHHRGVATAITVFAVLWTAASVVLFIAAPILVALVFALFDALFVGWALSLWLTEYRVTLDRGLLTLTRSGFMARAPIEVPQQWVRAVRTKRGMQAGNKLYYDLEVETPDGTHTAASSLADYDVASWLARYWTDGGERR